MGLAPAIGPSNAAYQNSIRGEIQKLTLFFLPHRDFGLTANFFAIAS